MAQRPDLGALVATLTEGIASLTSSAEWRRFLDYQSRFHHYSFANVLLIAAQRPEATQIAGFQAWKRLHRVVRKGETAIWILAPMVYKVDERGSERRIRGFKRVAVFDVAQTDGEELPSVCHRLEGDDLSGAYERLLLVAHTIGFEVESHTFDGVTNGDCCPTLRRIRIEPRNAPAQRVKTLAHEITHALLHHDVGDRGLAELEAESASFVVCRALGIDSGRYSFGYVTVWAGGGDEAIAGIKESCRRIQFAASVILDRDRSDVRPAATLCGVD